jgi:hypothetical protein
MRTPSLRGITVVVSSAVLAAAACTSSETPTPIVVTTTVGPSGGHVASDNVVLNVPAGALANPTAITISEDPRGPLRPMFRSLRCTGSLPMGSCSRSRCRWGPPRRVRRWAAFTGRSPAAQVTRPCRPHGRGRPRRRSSLTSAAGSQARCRTTRVSMRRQSTGSPQRTPPPPMRRRKHHPPLTRPKRRTRLPPKTELRPTARLWWTLETRS